jgi:hypothetical protein
VEIHKLKAEQILKLEQKIGLRILVDAEGRVLSIKFQKTKDSKKILIFHSLILSYSRLDSFRRSSEIKSCPQYERNLYRTVYM